MIIIYRRKRKKSETNVSHLILRTLSSSISSTVFFRFYSYFPHWLRHVSNWVITAKTQKRRSSRRWRWRVRQGFRESIYTHMKNEKSSCWAGGILFLLSNIVREELWSLFIKGDSEREKNTCLHEYDTLLAVIRRWFIGSRDGGYRSRQCTFDEKRLFASGPIIHQSEGKPIRTDVHPDLGDESAHLSRCSSSAVG